MREIKFRGMTEAGEWFYGGYVKRNNAHYILDGECDHVEVDGREANILHFHIVKYKTVGEYTSLKDKNGVEIYEGDIVSFDSFIWQIEEMWCGWRLMEPKNAFNTIGLDRKPLKDWPELLEVIGNIWENPELLEKPSL